MGKSLSCVGPEIGRLMFANWPPFGFFQVQTLGGVYSDELVICSLKLIARGSFKRFQPMAGARLPMSKRCGAGEGHRDMFAQLHPGLACCPAGQRAQAVRPYARRRR